MKLIIHPLKNHFLLCSERFWERDRIVGGGSFTDAPIASIWYPSDHAKYINNPDIALAQINNLPWNNPGVLIRCQPFF